MLLERYLLDDGYLSVVDVRCQDAPVSAERDERTSRATLVIPLAGIFVRRVHRAAGSGPRESIGDPSRALVFRAGESYRVSHPLEPSDRCLVINVGDGRLDRIARDQPSVPHVQLAARRLARALAEGRWDPLSGAELSLRIVASLAAAPRTPSPYPAGRRAERTAALVRLTVSGHLGERMSLPQLGSVVGLSGWEVARQFRQATGTTIHRYRTRLRLETALERIEQGERDLTQLALELGFADHSHMTSTIARTHGRPPSAFRLPPSAAELAVLRTNLQA